MANTSIPLALTGGIEETKLVRTLKSQSTNALCIVLVDWLFKVFTDQASEKAFPYRTDGVNLVHFIIF